VKCHNKWTPRIGVAQPKVCPNCKSSDYGGAAKYKRWWGKRPCPGCGEVQESVTELRVHVSSHGGRNSIRRDDRGRMVSRQGKKFRATFAVIPSAFTNAAGTSVVR